MSNAFQNNAFQPDAFQAHGGVTSGIAVNINATQEGDSGLLTVSVASAQRIGVPGPRNRFVVYINGKRFYGTQDEINRILRDLAREDADTVLEGQKAPKRRIVVQAKRIVEKPAPGEPVQIPQVAGFEFKLAQDEFRRAYLAELSRNILRTKQDEEDDDETVLMLIEQDQQQIQRQVLQLIQSILGRLK